METQIEGTDNAFLNQILFYGRLESTFTHLLRHSVHHFQPNSGGIACWVAETNAALCLNIRAKKWKYQFK